MAFSGESLLRTIGRILVDALKDSGKKSPARTPSRRSSDRTHSAHSSTPSRSRGGDTTRTIREVRIDEALSHLSYAPSADGDADPGEVVWTWVPFEEDATQGKDRPVVVLGRDGTLLYVVQLTSKDHDRDAASEAHWGRYWLDIGSGPWDPRGRPSEVRVNRTLAVEAAEVRREGATLAKSTWLRIVDAVREHA